MLKLLSNPIIIVIFTILSIIFFFSLERTGNRRLQSAETINQLEHEVTSLESEVEHLTTEVTQADSSLNQEMIFRNELLMKKPGEYVVQLPDITATQQAENQEAHTTNPLQEWQSLFLGN